MEIPSRRKLFKYLSFDRNVNSIQLITIKFSSTRGMGAQLRRNCFPYILQKRCLRTHSSKSKSKQEERDFSEKNIPPFCFSHHPNDPYAKRMSVTEEHHFIYNFIITRKTPSSQHLMQGSTKRFITATTTPSL